MVKWKYLLDLLYIKVDKYKKLKDTKAKFIKKLEV